MTDSPEPRPDDRERQLLELRQRLSDYQNLFVNMTEGFALGEVLTNAAGELVDFRYLEVNEAFYRQTGLPRDILGQPSLQWAPRQEGVWRRHFFEVVRTGQPVRIQDFNVDTGRHYEMYCYRPYPDRFAILFRDISERVRTEQELSAKQRSLEETEQRYAALFHNRLHGIIHGRVVTDEQGRPVDFVFERVNAAYEHMMGLDRSRVEGRRITEVFPGIERSRHAEVIREYLRIGLEGGERQMEVFFEFTEQWYGVYVYSHARGEFTVIFSDISEKKQAELALSQSEAQLRATFDQIGVGVSHVDREGRFLRVNRKFCELMGFDADELRHMHTFDISYPPDRDIGFRDLQRMLDGKVEGFTVEKRYVRKDGRLIWVRITGAPVCDPETGRPLYCVGMAEDITERKQVQAELESFFRQAAVGVFVLGLDRRIQRVNAYASHLLGYSEAEMLHMHMESLCHPDEIASSLHLFKRIAAGEMAEFTLEKRYRHKDGHYLWSISSLARGGDDSNEASHVVDVIMDISLRKNLEQELLRARSELEARVEQRTQELRLASWQAEEALRDAEAANRAKSEFLATMSHEIRTPLNGVIGFNGLLLSTPLNDQQRHYARLARQSGEALLHLLNDFLDFSKIESGRLELEPVVFDLQLEAGHVLALVQKNAEDKGLELRSRIDVTGRLRGDGARLRQILLNLLSNAVKFTAQGHVTLSCEEVARDGDSVRIRFRVSDTGIGIDDSTRRRLFQPFMQADASTTRRFGGTGLGLAISKRLAEAMGGEIGFDSRPGEGSTFWVELPFDRVDATTQTLSDPGFDSLEAAADGVCRGRVLVAEDNAVSQVLAAEVFKRLGFIVDVAGNGQEAVEAFKSRPYDLVCMDCDMPVMNGFDATRAIRAAESAEQHVPIIAMTASALQGDAEKCIAAGMDDFMSKPLRLGQLTQVLERWLHKE